MNQQATTVASSPQYIWAIDFCLNKKCTMTRVGTHRTLVNVPKPPLACAASTSGKVVKNSVKINDTSKDYVMACVKENTTYQEFSRNIATPVFQSFGAVTTVSTAPATAPATQHQAPPATQAPRPTTANTTPPVFCWHPRCGSGN